METDKITDYFFSISNMETAEHSKKFFKAEKGGYGYGDRFLGIRVPQIREAVRKFKNFSIEGTEKLLNSEFHEIRLFALLFMVSKFQKSGSKEKEEIYKIYMSNTRFINNWDLVDSSAPYIPGEYLFSRDRSVLYKLAESADLWERRISVISTFYFIKNNQFEDTLRITELLIHDTEDLIHKAAGWMLREIGKRDISAEKKFLDKFAGIMPRTMLRYSIEKFSREERSKYLYYGK